MNGWYVVKCGSGAMGMCGGVNVCCRVEIEAGSL